MITLSARCLSRAWLAVQLASSNDEGRAILYRTVHVEVHDTGVRLVSTDGYWLAHCWVPAWDELTTISPDQGPAGEGTEACEFDEAPNMVATVADVDHRVRDMMRFLVRATNAKGALDQPVEVDFAGRIEHDDTPTLLPEWAERAVVFNLTTGERVVAENFDAEWVSWRTILSHGNNGGSPCGVTALRMYGERFADLAKIAAIVASDDVTLDLHPTRELALWSLAPSTRLEHLPAGLVALRKIADTVPTHGVQQGSPDSAPDSPNLSVPSADHNQDDTAVTQGHV